jgi:hypothetical protein
MAPPIKTHVSPLPSPQGASVKCNQTDIICTLKTTLKYILTLKLHLCLFFQNVPFPFRQKQFSFPHELLVTRENIPCTQTYNIL